MFIVTTGLVASPAALLTDGLGAFASGGAVAAAHRQFWRSAWRRVAKVRQKHTKVTSRRRRRRKP